MICSSHTGIHLAVFKVLKEQRGVWNLQKRMKREQKTKRFPNTQKASQVCGENRWQMFLPKPEEETFTTWCTLSTKLVPAALPGFSRSWCFVKGKNLTLVEHVLLQENKPISLLRKTKQKTRASKSTWFKVETGSFSTALLFSRGISFGASAAKTTFSKPSNYQQHRTRWICLQVSAK